MAIRSKQELVGVDPPGLIRQRIPDNNAGLISAADVRNSLIDTVDSIEKIVSESNFTNTPFKNDVTLETTNGAGGTLYVESGINFSNGGGIQTVPYPGPTGISHNSLGGLSTGDPHTQYLPVGGGRPMGGNLGLGTNWLNSSGNADITSNGRGLRFNRVSPTNENINVGSGTSFVYLRDSSTMNSARGVAKAWIRFDATSGVEVGKTLYVLDSYNISGIKHEDAGKFTITFNSGVFKDNNYLAIGHSNARSTANGIADFSQCTVSTVNRTGNDGTSLRKVSFAVLDDSNTYVNAKINELVVFGTEPAGSGNTSVTIE
jgi:hypothetical protein